MPLSLVERARLMQQQRAQPLPERRAVVAEAAKSRRQAAMRTDFLGGGEGGGGLGGGGLGGGGLGGGGEPGPSGVVLLHKQNAPSEMQVPPFPPPRPRPVYFTTPLRARAGFPTARR